MKKKIVSALMVAAMVVTAFAGCGSDKGGTSTQGGDKTSKSSGKVYMLNFKPETDEAWQDLAETYTDQTGVEVNVLTAADGQYSTTQHYSPRWQSQMHLPSSMWEILPQHRHGTIIHMI
jgi:raffinose/stachyose/melibiose transport system substrate-binding protein